MIDFVADANAGKQPQPAVHPRGSRARVLLSSVFGPYGCDDEYGSRAINPMELYHNQVTRVQGPFSLRMFHRSWGLMFIQANIEAPCTLLDYPTLDRFIREIRDNEYDIVGISGIPPNILKVKKMCELVRQYLPKATIIVGGHIANLPELSRRIDADRIVKGEGVRAFRAFLGEDKDKPLRHPLIVSAVETKTVGITLDDSPGEVAATVIPSVGCPMGCNFCSTSAMFGGKGKFINFYETGDELFDIMSQLEEAMAVQSFFIMDENFLLQRKRALRLLALMEEHDKAWSLNVFSSGAVLRKYTMSQLVGLGISWVWMGLEGRNSAYEKLRGIDTRELVKDLHAQGIRVLGSSIIGLEEHTPQNINEVIDYAVGHNTDFHQFMLYTAVPGTPLHADLSSQGLLKSEDECSLSDTHGQLTFNYRHPHIKDGRETEYLLRAFTRDFEVNGPSILRNVRTLLTGWKRHKKHPNPRIRRRYEWEARELPTTFSALAGATRLYYRGNREMSAKISALLKDLYAEFGLKSRLASAVGGRWLLRKLRKEEKRLAAGQTYEPQTFYERNYEFADPDTKDRSTATLCRSVTPRIHCGSAKISRKPAAAFPEATGASAPCLERGVSRSRSAGGSSEVRDS